MAKPKIGLALGSGAARGWSHIGVLEELRAIGITPDIVTGSSVGAVVGAAFAAGKLDEFRDWILALDRIGVIRLLDAKLSGGGFVQGRTLLAAIEKIIGNPQIEDLDIRFGCVATEFGTGREVWLRKGKTLDAIRASMAMPGVFAPLRVDERYLLDGGLVNPVPVSLTRAMGADIVIAVNLNGDLVGHELFLHDTQAAELSGEPVNTVTTEDNGEAVEDSDNGSLFGRWTSSIRERFDRYTAKRTEGVHEPGLFDVVIGSIDIMQDRITRARMAGEPPDVHITPRLRDIGVMDFDRASDAIEEGRAATHRQRHDLEALKRALDRLA